MIGKLIEWCVRNRAIVLILTGFVIAAGVWGMFSIKVDAIPDLSDVQVIIKTEYAGQAPEIVEKQVTYPLTTAMLQVPYAKVVRGYSMFGDSFVYVIFEDGTDQYWARSRVLEQLSFIASKLPQGVSPQLGPDATGVGWIYQYVLTTGAYCPEHPQGLYHDKVHDKWYANPADAPEGVELKHQRTFAGYDQCPLAGTPLKQPDVDLANLRSLQDWYLRYELTSVDGVSEVAPIGGFVKQYQVVVDPIKLRARGIALSSVKMAIERSNIDVGGRLIEMSESEYVVRGVGYLGSLSEEEIADAKRDGKLIQNVISDRVLAELRKIALAASAQGAPVYLADVADVRVGPDIRNGVAEWNGQGETVGGVIVMRAGENARSTIDAVKAKLDDLKKGLPPGVNVETAYDRSDLIDRAVGTLRKTLLEEITVVAIVCICFLLHARSELVAVFVVPTGVLISLLAMHLLGVNANIMSLGGIAIAIGVMVDSSIVMVENAHKHLDREEERLHADPSATPRQRTELILDAAKEVGPSLFFSLLIIVVSFLPVFVLGDQAGRMFKPLAYTKTFAMGAGAFLAVTIIPVLMTFLITPRILPRRWGWRVNLATTVLVMFIPAMLLMAIPLGVLTPYRLWLAVGWAVLMAMLLVPQKIIHENVNPLSRILQAIYHPFFVLVMRFPVVTLVVALLLTVATLYPMSKLGSEFMPPLEEGDLLYMPTAEPGISIGKARELLQQTDALIKSFPEVESVMGKIGRAESATDPAPINMFETTITLSRDKSKWRQVNQTDWLGNHTASTRPINASELVYGYEMPDGTHVPGLNEVVQIPGLTNSWTMPIKTRIDMLSTGIKTPVGVKVMGSDLATLSDLATQVSNVLKTAEGTGPYTVSAFPERTIGGNYLDIKINRDEIARYNLQVQDVQDVITTALGGMNVTSTVEGLERYPVNLRYPHELRDNLPALKQTLVATPSGAQVPLVQLAEFEIRRGAPMVKSENARLTSWVFVDIAGLDVGTYVKSAQKVVADRVKLPAGYSLVWSGQFEYMQAASARLWVAIPLAIVVVVLLLYLATRSWLRVGIVCLAMPFSLIGAFWLLYLMDYNFSVAVAVGLIALVGLDAETGLVMLLYLDASHERFAREGRMRNRDDLWHAVHDGAVKRIRPKTMTVVTTFIGLVPLIFASGAGADTMRRLAAPMIGGLASSFLLELLIYPVIFYMARRIGMWWQARATAPAS